MSSSVKSRLQESVSPTFIVRPSFLQQQLNYFCSCDNEQLVPIIEDHSECDSAVRLENLQVSTVAVKHLHAFHVADIYFAVSIHCDRLRSAKLPGLLTFTTKLIEILSIRTKLEDCIVESSERINVPVTIDGYPHVEL